MSKLHELIAVEPDLKVAAQQEASRVLALFTKGRGKFEGSTQKYHPLDEAGERLEPKLTPLGAAVDAELASLQVIMSRYVDAAMEKEITNTITKADVIVDDAVILGGLPTPALLNLEKRLLLLRKVYEAIPVLDPSERWEYDEGLKCHVSQERRQYRSKKYPRTLVKAEATEFHPAQVEVWMEDVQVGTWSKLIFSGAITLARKAKLLDRISILHRAVKEARQRANCAEVARGIAVADAIFEFINKE